MLPRSPLRCKRIPYIRFEMREVSPLSSTPQNKQCKSCNELKPVEKFGLIGPKYLYRLNDCKLCRSRAATQRRGGPKPKLKNEAYYRRRLRRKLKRVNLTEAEYHQLPKYCQICGRTDKLRLDHDHTTGQFRGVLCDACNTAIGLLQENPEILLRAAQYVRRTQSGGIDRAPLIDEQRRPSSPTSGRATPSLPSEEQRGTEPGSRRR